MKRKINEIKNNFKWNIGEINSNQLDETVLEKTGFEKLYENELFVEHPEQKYEKYYVSQYGRAISFKRRKPKLLKKFLGGQPDCLYDYWGFTGSDDHKTKTIGIHNAVAKVFCPNFWGNDYGKLVAHHIDHNRFNNRWDNLILLTTELHAAIHKIKQLVLFKEGKIIEYNNPLDLVWETGLTLDDILMPYKNKKPLKNNGGYTVYEVDGYLLGYKYYPTKKKNKK